jgi:hypothetical protein
MTATWSYEVFDLFQHNWNSLLEIQSFLYNKHHSLNAILIINEMVNIVDLMKYVTAKIKKNMLI